MYVPSSGSLPDYPVVSRASSATAPTLFRSFNTTPAGISLVKVSIREAGTDNDWALMGEYPLVGSRAPDKA